MHDETVKFTGFLIYISAIPISVPPSAVPASIFYCRVRLSAGICDDTSKWVRVTSIITSYLSLQNVEKQSVIMEEIRPKKTERFAFASLKLV